mgnify:FL=1
MKYLLKKPSFTYMDSGSERKLSLPLLLTFILGFSHFSTYDFLLSVLFHNLLKFILMPCDPCLPVHVLAGNSFSEIHEEFRQVAL